VGYIGAENRCPSRPGSSKDHPSYRRNKLSPNCHQPMKEEGGISEDLKMKEPGSLLKQLKHVDYVDIELQMMKTPFKGNKCF
jgi:hypothetical protein